MADDPKKRGQADRSKVSHQKHEIAYVAKKTDMPKKLVEKIVTQVGSSRAKVEAKLTQMKQNAKKK